MTLIIYLACERFNMSSINKRVATTFKNKNIPLQSLLETQIEGERLIIRKVYMEKKSHILLELVPGLDQDFVRVDLRLVVVLLQGRDERLLQGVQFAGKDEEGADGKTNQEQQHQKEVLQ